MMCKAWSMLTIRRMAERKRDYFNSKSIGGARSGRRGSHDRKGSRQDGELNIEQGSMIFDLRIYITA